MCREPASVITGESCDIILYKSMAGNFRGV